MISAKQGAKLIKLDGLVNTSHKLFCCCARAQQKKKNYICTLFIKKKGVRL